MNLGDALDWPSGGNNQPAGGGVWPGQPSNPGFPGGPSPNPTWPGGPSPNPTWPGGPSPNPTWPSAGGGGGGGGGAWPSPQPTAPGGWPNPGGPGPGPGPAPAPGPGPVPSFPQQNLAVPFHQKLPSGIYDKLLITIAGTVKSNADKFTVDLSSGKDIAFHFNPRFNDQGQKTIVRNSFIGQQWGTEERELKNFPFVQGRSFEIKILCTNTEYKVAVDGSHLLTFRHRFNNLSSIKLFAVYYDVTLSKVTMEKLH